MIKDAFLFHALFCFISFLFLFWFSRYLNVCPDFFGHVVKKFMTSKIGKQIIAVHILSNISISKSKQTMEFGQLIACNMRNIFLEKSCTKNEYISGSTVWNVAATVEHLLWAYINLFQKNKKSLELVSLLHFLDVFWKKIFPMLCPTGQFFLSDCLYFLRHWAICVVQLFVCQSATLKIMKLTLAFLLSPFPTWPKSQNKNVNLLRRKTIF